MKTLTKFVAVAGVATLALTACSSGQKASSESSSDAASKGASFKACAVSDAGGWDDKSFNESAYNGLKAAQSKLRSTRQSPPPRQTSCPTPNPWFPTAAT